MNNTPADRLSQKIETVLREQGLTDKPGTFDSSIHSWRCEHPDRYGACACLQDMTKNLVDLVLTEIRREILDLDSEHVVLQFHNPQLGNDCDQMLEEHIEVGTPIDPEDDSEMYFAGARIQPPDHLA